MSMKDHLRRGEIVAEHEGENLYDVLLSGAMYPISRVPCLNFSKVYVGLNVVVDMSDQQCPTILSAASTTQWIGTRDPEPRTIEEDGWHFYEGHYDHSGWLSTIPDALYVPDWKIPGDGTQHYPTSTPRTVAWYDTDGTRREVLISGIRGTDYGSHLTAWDVLNSYTLGSALGSTAIAPKNTNPYSVTVAASSEKDVGKAVVIYGEDINNRFSYDKIIIQNGRYGTSSRPFKSIAKIEIRKTTPVGTMGAWTTMAGSGTISCGSVYETLSAGDQLKFVGTPQKVTLVPTDGSYDSGKNSLSLRRGSFLCVGSEWMQVAGVDGGIVTIGARGLFGTNVVAHIVDPNTGTKDPVMSAAWTYYNYFPNGEMAVYMDILYSPTTRTGKDGNNLAYMDAIDVRTGDFLWTMPTCGKTAAGQIKPTIHVGIVTDKVPNPTEPLSASNPLVVLSPADANNWNPTSNPYSNKDAETPGFVEGYVVVITGQPDGGMAALNRRTGELLWSKTWNEVLPETSNVYTNDNIANGVVTRPSTFNNFTTTLPSGYTVYLYYKYIGVNKTYNQAGQMSSLRYKRSACYRVIDTSNGDIKGDYEFPRSTVTDAYTGGYQYSFSKILSYDGDYGYLRTVPDPDGTGVDFITITKSITEYDYQKGYPDPVVEGNTTIHGSSIVGISSSSFRITSHRLSADGTMVQVYDKDMSDFPDALSTIGNKNYTVMSFGDVSGSSLNILLTPGIAWNNPSGYCNGSLDPSQRRIIYLIQEAGLQILREWLANTTYDWGLDGQVLKAGMTRPPGPDDIVPNSGDRQYEVIRTDQYYQRDAVGYALGTRVIVVNPYTGACTAASNEYLDDPSEMATDDGNGQRARLATDEMISKYSALSDYKYHDPVIGLHQNLTVIKKGSNRADKKTATTLYIDETSAGFGPVAGASGSLRGDFTQYPLNQLSYGAGLEPGFYNSSYGVLQPAQSANGTVFFGREQLRDAETLNTQET